MMHPDLRRGVFLGAVVALMCCGGSAPGRSVASAASPVLAPAAATAQASGQTPLPNKPDTLHFAVIGDNGNGDKGQYEIGEQMAAWYGRFQFPLVLMMGDNIYGSERPQDFKSKFETPYKPLLDANIPFYAALGNHDDPNQRFYKPFGMNGQRFYTYQKKDVRFFALDSNYMDKDQQAWLEKELSASNSKWKIAYFHHPLYSSGATHGSEVDLRTIIEPLFKKYNVNVVFAGHEHFYERIKPQGGIYYFTAGGSAKLRAGDLRSGTNLTAKGFDTEQSFMVVELDGDVMRFQTISKRGQRVDSGEITRQNAGTQ